MHTTKKYDAKMGASHRFTAKDGCIYIAAKLKKLTHIHTTKHDHVNTQAHSMHTRTRTPHFMLTLHTYTQTKSQDND